MVTVATKERFMEHLVFSRTLPEKYRADVCVAGGGAAGIAAAAKALPKSAWSDSTHLYTPLGTRALGGAVAQAIRSQWAR